MTPMPSESTPIVAPPLSRRDALRNTVALCFVAAGGVVAAACSKKDEGSKELSCVDTSSLPPQDIQLRTSLAYVDRSPDAAKVCSNCQQFNAPAAAGSCGSCKLVKGPINPAGYCNSWAAKAA